MSYTFKPYRGYHVQDVAVDGKSMGQLDSYTFSSASESHTIHVTLEKDEVKVGHTKLEHADSAGVQRSSPEKSQTAVKHTAADILDSTGNRIWSLAGVVSIFIMLCTGIYRFKRGWRKSGLCDGQIAFKFIMFGSWASALQHIEKNSKC